MHSDEHNRTEPDVTTEVRRPGHELATARDRAGIDRVDMARTLHLPERQLEALERDDYQHLPPPAYVRGYLRAYAREVGLDGDDIVGAYDGADGASEDPAIVVHAPVEPAHSGRGALGGLVVVMIVVLAGLGGWWWQAREPVPPGRAPTAQATDDGSSAVDDTGATGEAAGDDAETSADAGARAVSEPDADSEADADTVGSQAAGTMGADAGSGSEAGAGDAAAAPETDAVEPASAEGATEAADEPGADGDTDTVAEGASPDAGTEPAGGGEQVATADSGTDGTGDGAGAATDDTGDDDEGGASEVAEYEPPDATASADEAVAPAAAEGPDTILLDVDGRSWIEVTDARGRELVYTLYSGGEPLRLRGWAPFDVFLGNSPAVSLRFEGEAVTKGAFTRSDQTARFLVDADGARRR